MAFDPNTIPIVIGSVVVAMVTAGPMWISARKTRTENKDQHGASVEALRSLERVVLQQGFDTLEAIAEVRKEVREHVNDKSVHF